MWSEPPIQDISYCYHPLSGEDQRRSNFSELSQLTDAEFETLRDGWKVPEAYLFTWEQHSVGASLCSIVDYQQ